MVIPELAPWIFLFVIVLLKVQIKIYLTGPEHKDEQPVWELMPVQEFFTFNIPFEMEGKTKVGIFKYDIHFLSWIQYPKKVTLQ